jgi:2-polyprenyl-6-methoxyphenol hydroxylase-like FAD-dependent oxidoreductase
VAINRGRLHQLLLEAFGGEGLHLGAAASGYAREGAGVILKLADGRAIAGRGLIGADGVHSAIRAQLLGDTPRRYVSYTAWRGLCPAEDLVPEGFAEQVFGPASRFGYSRLGDGNVYWFATYAAPPDEAAPDPLALLRSRFGSWAGPVPALIEATPPGALLQTDIYDRVPAPRWTDGPVTLLGDAAHPMAPDLGQGACQALEDAMMLVAAQTDMPSVAAGFDAYEQLRRRHTAGVVKMAYRVAHFDQPASPWLNWLRDRFYAMVPTSLFLRQLEALARPMRELPTLGSG